jgi:hypothetical protein
MPSFLLSPAFEDKVFEIIESTSFKELLNLNRIEDKRIIAEYQEVLV